VGREGRGGRRGGCRVFGAGESGAGKLHRPAVGGGGSRPPGGAVCLNTRRPGEAGGRRSSGSAAAGTREAAAHPGEQRRCGLGRAGGHTPDRADRQGPGGQRPGRVSADSAPAPAVASRRQPRRPRTSDQHRIDRRALDPDLPELRVLGQQGGRAHADPPSGSRAGERSHHGQFDRTRPLPDTDDSHGVRIACCGRGGGRRNTHAASRHRRGRWRHRRVPRLTCWGLSDRRGDTGCRWPLHHRHTRPDRSPLTLMRVAMLAGRTGAAHAAAAKLAVGLQAELPPGELSVITNTADDLDFWGLRVCPDTDAVLFRLAGIFNDEAGFGVAEETFNVHAQMTRLGEPAWFWLGDRDLAFHIVRTAMLRRNARLTETALELGRRLGLSTKVLPMSDDEGRTVFETDEGRYDFQEYFVLKKHKPRLCGIELIGMEAARPAPEALAAVSAADLVVVGPSNPLISIGPITALLGPALRYDHTVAISPIVGGRALKGPTVEMMVAL